MWNWPPLVVNEASHGLNGEGVENAPPAVHYLDLGPQTTSLVSSRWYKLRGGKSFALYIRP
jgi:hypothetical protein